MAEIKESDFEGLVKETFHEPKDFASSLLEFIKKRNLPHIECMSLWFGAGDRLLPFFFDLHGSTVQVLDDYFNCTHRYKSDPGYR